MSIFLILCSVILAAEKAPQIVLAKVGTEVITADDFKKTYMPQGADSSKLDSLKHASLDKLIGDKLMLIDARTKGFQGKITNELADFRNRLTVGALYKTAVSKRIKVSPWAVRDSWWKTGITVKASHILVKDKTLAWKICRELRKGATFEELAPQYSEDQATAQQGGLLPDIKWGTRDPEFEKVVFSLKPGKQISFPIKTAQGYEIIQVRERSDKKRKPDFKTESERIKRQFMSKKERELADNYLAHLKRIAHIKFYKNALNEIVKPEITESAKKMILVKWAGGKFTVGETLEQANMGMPGRTFPDTSSVKSWVINRLTYQYLLPAEAARYGFHRLPDIKAQVTERENSMLIQKYRQSEIEEKSKPTDDEIKEYWTAHQKEYGKNFELVKARIDWDLGQKKRVETEKKVVETLRQTIPVEVSEINLKTI